MNSLRTKKPYWNCMLMLFGGSFLSAIAHAARPNGPLLVGDPKHPEALAQEIQDAYQRGARQIVILPGVYLLPKTDHATFVLEGWHDAMISAYGVTLISSENKWNRDLFDLRHCTNVTLAGPILSQTGLTFYQGHVVGIGQDATSRAYCDWRPDVGYPIPPLGITKFPSGANVVDAQTRRLKIGIGDFYDLTMEANGTSQERPAGDGTFRLHFHDPKVRFTVGDWIVGRYGEAAFKVFLDNSRNCTIRDVAMMRNGFSPLREDRGGGNRILNCRWTLGPRPNGAVEEPLITNAADGFHSTGANPGPDVENCTFDGIFLDDCIAIHGDFQKIKGASTGNTIVVENGHAYLTPGEPARIASGKGLFEEVTVTAIKDNGDKTSTVTLDRTLTITADDSRIYNPLHCGAGYKIIDCTLGETRSRGLLLKADNGLVRGNTIVECGMSAVSIGPEFYWNEAGYVKNVVVENNVFRGNGKAGYGGGTVLVHGDGAVGNSGIVVRNNHFYSSFQGDITLEWTDGATLTGNVMSGGGIGGERPGSVLPWPAWLAMPAPVSLKDSHAIVLKDNAIKNAAQYKSPLVAVGANVTAVHNDDSSEGIRGGCR